jgi:hypothetical protein
MTLKYNLKYTNVREVCLCSFSVNNGGNSGKYVDWSGSGSALFSEQKIVGQTLR